VRLHLPRRVFLDFDFDQRGRCHLRDASFIYIFPSKVAFAIKSLLSKEGHCGWINNTATMHKERDQAVKLKSLASSLLLTSLCLSWCKMIQTT
jgi:hypothetical protein